ncbi:MAG: major facilitator superfamily 1 [Frankiales bacterium]|nr:major facilitator superfamily 1 [Frankiales bacterium]
MWCVKETSLWRVRDFTLLWAGQTVSEVGSQVTMLALPLLATISLHATTFEVAALSAASSLAFLLFALQAGAWVDRRRKRPILVWSDVLRAITIGTIPIAYGFDALTIWQLYVVAMVSSILTVFFDVAYQSFLPFLVRRDQLVEANAKLSSTGEVARFLGPAMGGGLVSAVGAPMAVLLDAGSFVVSAIATAGVRDKEPQPAARPEGMKLRHEIAEGLTFVVRHPILKRVVACTGTSNFFSNLFGAVEVVFLVRHLHATPTEVGLVYTLAAIGGIVGALVANPLARWLGSARVVWVSLVATSPFVFAGVFATPGWGIWLMSVSSAAMGLGAVVYNVAQVSYRQSICPPRLLGRMNAAVRFIVWGTMPLGALTGGVLGTTIGVRETLFVGAAGMCLAVGWVLASPLFGRRDFPPEEADALEALLLDEQRKREEG